jgi:hypothetical protein
MADISLQPGFDKPPKSKIDEIHEMVTEIHSHMKKDIEAEKAKFAEFAKVNQPEP